MKDPVAGRPPEVGLLAMNSGMLGTMVIELVPPETGRGFGAMRELRTGLAGRDEFTEQIDRVQRPTGYRLIAVMSRDGGDALAVAGFRQGINLAWGRHLYVDDLSTVSSARGHGFAGQLLDWIYNEAVRQSCDQIHLDSGVG